MEQYVYISTIFFSIIIILLYNYVIFAKVAGDYKNKRIQKYSKELEYHINSTVKEVLYGKEIDFSTLKKLKMICKNKYKREIVEQRLLYYFENSQSEFLANLTDLCHHIEIIKFEIKNLKSNNNFKKAFGAKRLGEFRSKKVVDILLHELKGTNSDIQYNILLALAKIGEEHSFIKAFKKIDSKLILSERSLMEIIDSFEGDKNKIYKYLINCDNDFIACAAIKSAGNYKDISLSQDISKYFLNENKELRIACVQAIGSIGDERYLDDIIRLLEDNESEVRAVTANVLGSFAGDKVIIPLSKALSDPEWDVKYNTATSLLNFKAGMNVIKSYLCGNDKSAKDSIMAAMANLSDNTYLYETLNDLDKIAVNLKINQYIMEKNEEVNI